MNPNIRIENLTKVLKRLEVEEGLKSYADIGRKYNVNPTYLSQLMNRTRNLGEKSARKLEESLNLKKFSLDSCIENNQTSINGDNIIGSDVYVDKSQHNIVNHNNPYVSENKDSSIVIYQHANATSKDMINLGDYIIDKFHGTNKEQIFVTPVLDDEMFPILRRGSFVIGDSSRANRSILAGYIYVLRTGNTLHCRYLEEMPNDEIRVYSEKDQKGEIISKQEFKDKYKLKGGVLLTANTQEWI